MESESVALVETNRLQRLGDYGLQRRRVIQFSRPRIPTQLALIELFEYLERSVISAR